MAAVVKVVKKVVTAVVGAIENVVNWVVDEIIEPVVKGVGDVIQYVLDDPIKAIATVAAFATGNMWAIPLIDGAAVLANGGNLGDAIKAAAISYAGGKLGSTAGQWATKAVADAGGHAIVANIVGAGTKSATTALVYGQDPLKAFVTGGLQAGVAAGMGKISETMQEQYGSKFESLQGGVKDTIFAGLAAELEGGNLSDTQMGSIIAKYSGVGDAMNTFLTENAGFSDAQAAILTNATAAAVSKAIAGNPDGAGEAFFGSISAAGADALKAIIDKPVNTAIDKVSGAYDAAEAKAEVLNATVTKAKNAADEYNALQEGLAGKIQTQDGLKAAYDRANNAYIKNPSEAAANKANAAAEKYNEYATALEKDYNKNYKKQMASAEAKFNNNNGKIADLEADYNDAMGWVVSKTEDLDAALKPNLSAADKAVALTLRPNFDEDAYREMNGLDADADVYDHFLQKGQAQPTDKAGSEQLLNNTRTSVAEQAMAAAGFDLWSMSVEQRDAVMAHVDKNVTSISSITGLDFDALVSGAVKVAEKATVRGDVLPTAYPIAEGVTANDIVMGNAIITYADGEYKWQKPAAATADIAAGGGNVSTIDADLAAAFGGVVGESSYVSDNPNVLKLTIYASGATLPEMINTAQSSSTGSLPTGIIKQIAELGDEAGRLLDTYVTAPIYESAKGVYNFINAGTGGGLGNAGSIVIGAGGEMLQAIAGLSVLAGANPNNALGRAAKNMIALSGDMKSDEWIAAAEEMQANSAAYDEQWRKDNPGQEPSTAMKGVLKAQAIWGNIKNHPVQWISENVVSELLQEIPILLVSGGTGNVAKRLLLEAGEAQAKKIAARVSIGTGITLDAAEAFGGTAAGAFDEAYDTALRSGMDEQQATDYAMDVAQKAGTIAVMTLAATAGIGGQALSKSIFGGKGSKTFTDQYNVIKDQIKDGVKVTVKEGVTEFVEEALPQLYIATSLVQIDPSYDVAGSVFEAGIMGKLAGAGTAGGIYTGNVLADALLTTNSTVKNAVTNSGNAGAATQALKDLGISDNEVLNNLLNTTYDAQYVTTTEAGDMFAKENPGFTPTDGDLAKFTGKKDDSGLATAVAAYVDPRFLDVEEVKAAALAEGITLTDEQAEAYVGQKDEAGAVADITAEYDPQGTSRTEAEKFFTDLGFTPTKAQINKFVGATSDAEQKTAIGEYVDPRQTTEAEARKFFTDLGYEPTDEEVAEYVGQGGAAFESNKKKATDLYVDPRMVSDAEARKFFSDLGYEPTDEEIARFVDQVKESEQQTAIDKYVDPRFVTQAELEAIATQEGLTLTETLAATYLGQKNQKATLAAATKAFDPLATTTAEARQFFEDQGFTPTDQQVANFVASKTEEDQKAAVSKFVDPRQVTTDEATALFDALGYTSTPEEIAEFVGQGGAAFESNIGKGVGTYVDPRQVTDKEARKFFSDLGYDPTDEQVAQFVAQVEETTQQDVISKYVDPRQVTQAEVQAIADEEGLTLTDALAAAYVGQGEAENFQTDTLDAARTEYDPLATTLDEATQFFADTNYTATPEEIAEFVASKTEEVQTSAIGAYVDPRQMTSDEAREFLSAIGYNPTEEEVRQFTGQLNDENYQVTQKAEIDGYVDPRYVDAGEVRATFEELGLVDVSQEDVDRFVGQFDEETQLGEVRDYLPTATFNVIKSIMGSPAVEDDPNTDIDESKDATGIYAELEAGATRDEALEAAIDKVATDLGTTKADLLAEIGFTRDELRDEIGAVADELSDEIGDVADDVTDLTGVIGTEGVVDDPDTDVDETQDPTGIFATIAAYEAAGLSRDDALQKAIEDVSGALGIAEETLRGEIGDTEGRLTEEITDVKTQLTTLIEANEAAGMTRDEALQEAIGTLSTELGITTETLRDEIAASNFDLTGKIEEVETNLGTDIQAVADLVGKPARDVTQTDIDFVIDLIAQENISEELTLQYDVTGDGIVDINDQNMLTGALQGDQDAAFADTSMFNPATGLYLQQEQDTQTTQDLVTDLNTQINTQIQTNQQKDNIKDMMQMLEQSGDAAGQRVDVKTPDAMNLDYIYDFSSIFANPSQAGLFANPFSNATRNQPANQPMGPQPRASGFAEGGQVEDENDILLRLLGDV
jgi:hypothetical protein